MLCILNRLRVHIGLLLLLTGCGNSGPDSETFTHQVVIHPAGAGRVIVTSTDREQIACDQTCILRFSLDEEIVLTAEGTGSNTFEQWIGSCGGRKVDCKIIVNEDKEVDAIFAGNAEFITSSMWESIEVLDFGTGTANIDDPSARFDELEICFDVAGDIYCSTRESRDEPWRPALPIDIVNDINCPETTPRLSADGHVMLFTSSRSTEESDECTFQNLYQTTRKSLLDPWEEPTLIENVNDLKHDDQSPALSHDGLTMLFHSNRGGSDIYITTRLSVDSSAWTTPQIVSGSVSGNVPTHWTAAGLLIFNAGRSNFGVTFASRDGITGSAEIIDIDETEEDEQDGMISRDLRTLYYVSEVNGRTQILRAKHK